MDRNREENLAKQRANRAAKREAINRTYRKWYAKTKGSGVKLEGSRRRRARKQGAAVGNQTVIATWERGWRQKRRVKCYWCEKQFPPRQCETDHIVPLNDRGPHSIENLCISCGPCNRAKCAKPISEWNKRLTQPVLL